MHNEENYKQGEKTAFKWEKRIANEATDKKINLKNIEAAHAAQYQRNKLPNQKMVQRTKQTFLQRRHIDG